MMIVKTKEKLKKMVIETKNWHSKKIFTIMQGVILCGRLEHCVDTLPWAKICSS